MLDCYTFQGKIAFETFYGPEEYPIAFTLFRAPDSDPWLVNEAAQAIGMFLMEQHYQSSNMEDEDETGV